MITRTTYVHCQHRGAFILSLGLPSPLLNGRLVPNGSTKMPASMHHPFSPNAGQRSCNSHQSSLIMISMLGRSVRPYICSSCRHHLLRTKRRKFSSSSSSSSTPDIYDVVSVGGGPVGLAFLAALSEFALLPDPSRAYIGRIVTRHLPPQGRTNRIPRPLQITKLEAPARIVLKSRE